MDSLARPWGTSGRGGACLIGLLAGLLVPSCGARSGLLGGAGGSDEDASGLPDGSLAVTDGSPDSTTDAGESDQSVPDGPAEDAQAPVRCVLQPAGSPVEIASFPDQHADAPSLAVIDRGTAGGEPANVAVQAFRSGGSGFDHAIYAGRFLVEPPWPDGVTVTQPLAMVTADSFGWAELTAAPGATRELALVWHGGAGANPRTTFRTIDADTWAAHEPVELSFDGEAALGLAAGAGIAGMGAGYAGFGYAVVWRLSHPELPDAPMSPVVAVLDTHGSIQLGPHRMAEPMAYPGPSPSLAWSGRTYLLATSFRECVDGDPLCVPRSVVIARVRPATGDAVDNSGVDLVASIPVLDPAWSPGRASMASDGADTFVAWSEGTTDPNDDVRSIRLLRVDDQGNPVQGPVTIAQGVRLQQSVRVVSAPFGVSVVWPEVGDESLGYDEAGKSRIAVSQHDRALVETAPVVQIDATQFGSYGWATAVAIDSPRSLLVTWPGYPTSGGLGVSWLARLDCVDEPVADAGLDAPTDAEPGVDYFATVGPIGALDRVRLAKRDTQRDLCFRIGLAHPLDGAFYNIAVPDQWAVESASAVKGADKCAEPAWPDPVAVCNSAEGTIGLGWQPGEWMPCSIDVDAVLTFDGTQPWAPLQEVMKATGVPVSGACGQP